MRNKIAISLLILLLCAPDSFSAPQPPSNNMPMSALPGLSDIPNQVGAEAGDVYYRDIDNTDMWFYEMKVIGGWHAGIFLGLLPPYVNNNASGLDWTNKLNNTYPTAANSNPWYSGERTTEYFAEMNPTGTIDTMDDIHRAGESKGYFNGFYTYPTLLTTALRRSIVKNCFHYSPIHLL